MLVARDKRDTPSLSFLSVSPSLLSSLIAFVIIIVVIAIVIIVRPCRRRQAFTFAPQNTLQYIPNDDTLWMKQGIPTSPFQLPHLPPGSVGMMAVVVDQIMVTISRIG